MYTFLLLFLPFLSLFFANPVYAHLPGQPPFFKINGKFSNLYPVPQVSYIAITPFPQDSAPALYMVNTPIEFMFELAELSKVVPMEIINKTTFLWNFGDGTTGEGQKNTHTYKKEGSYVLSVMADTRSFEPTAEPQLIQSVLLHVVSDESYVLPETKILINGKDGNDVNGDWLQVNMNKPVIAESVVVRQGTNPIVSYEWDFGGGVTANGPAATHTYGTSSTSVMILLRVIDEKGFIVDKAVGVANNPSLYSVLNNPVVNKQAVALNDAKPKIILNNYVVVTVIIIISLLVVFLWKKSPKK